MPKLTQILAFVGIGIGLWGCSDTSKTIPPPMTQISLQICGKQLVRSQLQKSCLSNTAIYWGELSPKDIKLVEMSPQNDRGLEYYFVIISAAGCVADWAAPTARKINIMAIKSLYSEKVSGQSPKIEILSLVKVDERKRQLLVEETEEKLAFATLLGSQTTYSQPTCQNFKSIQQKLKARGYQEGIIPQDF